MANKEGERRDLQEQLPPSVTDGFGALTGAPDAKAGLSEASARRDVNLLLAFVLGLQEQGNCTLSEADARTVNEIEERWRTPPISLPPVTVEPLNSGVALAHSAFKAPVLTELAREEGAAAFVQELLAARREVARLTALINTPEIIDFVKAVQIEAVHQRERWGTDHDEGKTAADWFWLLGYLAGKALASDKKGDRDKMLHHIITTAAACANWHAQILGKCDMRPGISTPAGEIR